MKKLLYLFISLCPILILITCKKEAIRILPTVNTTTLTNITSTTATSGGVITNDGGAPITSRGVCWSLIQNPTISDDKTSNGSGSGSYTSYITGLTPGTTYYVRAYATNDVGTGYGNEVAINALAILPTLTTTVISSIKATKATGGGNITSDGGATTTSRGVCWSTNHNPTIADSKTTDGSGAGVFTSSITGLIQATTYYLRAYATNNVGTGYGNEITFATLISAPTGLSSIFNKTRNAVIISWSPVLDATSYRVYYSKDSTTSYNLLAEVIETSILDNNRYGYYKVSSVRNNRESEISDYIIESPSAPVNLATYYSQVDNLVKISWNNVSSAKNYRVYYSESAKGEYVFLVETSTLSTTDSNRNRYYKVSAVNRGGESRLRYAISENGRVNAREPLVDIEGNTYRTVQIGDQVWMAENLRVTKTPDGVSIPLVIANSAWESLTAESKAYCYYNNEKGNASTYGALYTWATALAVCPDGWHLPSSYEWSELMSYVRDNIEDGTVSSVLKSTQYGDGTDDYGFSALYAGGRLTVDGSYVTGFYGGGINVYWWGSNNLSIENYRAHCQGSYYHNGTIDNSYYTPKNGGHSVRYVKDK